MCAHSGSVSHGLFRVRAGAPASSRGSCPPPAGAGTRARHHLRVHRCGHLTCMAADPFYRSWAWRQLRTKTLARAAAEAAPCWRCGGAINYSLSGLAKWGPTAGHKIDRAAGGAALNPANVAPEHRHCNITAGASLGGRTVKAGRRRGARSPSASRSW